MVSLSLPQITQKNSWEKIALEAVVITILAILFSYYGLQFLSTSLSL